MLSTRRRANVLALLVLALGLAVLLGKILLGRQVLADSDILVYYYPVKTAIRNLFLHGESLLWNPLMGEGQPLAANPEHEIFYPFTWLLFAMPVHWALAVSQAAHLALAFWGTLRFLRKRRASEAAAILGAVSWSFGGLFVSSIHFFPIFYPWTWIPWLAETALERRFSWRAAARGALFGALIVLAGEPVTALMGAAVFSASFLSLPVTASRLRLAALAGLLALGLSCATWLPGAALARKGVRAQGIEERWANLRSFPPLRLAELVLPRATGNVKPKDDRLYLGWRLYRDGVWPFYWGLYGGALLLPLSAAGFLSRPRGRPGLKGFAAAGLVCFLLSLGPPGILWSAARTFFPPWRGIRYPEKFLAVTVFALVVALAAGLDAVRRSPIAAKLVCSAAGALGLILLTLAIAPSLWTPALQFQGIQTVLRSGVLRVLGLGGLLWLLLQRRSAMRLRALLFPVFLLAAALDVLGSSTDFINIRPVEWMEAPPPVVRRLLAASPIPRLVDNLPPWPPESSVLARIQSDDFKRSRARDMLPIQWGVPLALDLDFDLTYMAATHRVLRLFLEWRDEDVRVFARLLAGRGACALLAWNRPVSLEDPVTLLGVPRCRPEVDSRPAVIPFQGDEGFMRAARRYPGDLAQASFVEGPAADLPRSPAAATIGELSLRNTSVSFSAESAGTSLIRVARTNDGNWRASVDGKPWPLRTVDLSLLGIALPPGMHRVRIWYRDDLLTAAIAVSAATLLSVGILFVAGGRRDQIFR